ncbi:hypothetical protein ACEPAH_2335 [Sanghuangporus vaninii]
MCGRFALGLPRPQIIRSAHDEHPELDLDPDEWIDEEDFQPRFNIAPRSRSPVIRRRNRFDDRLDAPTEDAEHRPESDNDKKGSVMHTMKWGLIPHWSKHEDINLNTINAKGENLTEGGGMWGGIKGRKRCVVICQGYYEWQKKGKERNPHFTRHKDGKLMLLAGLYDSVILEGEKKPLYTFTVVTTDANKQLSWLHDRMPVVLSTSSQVSTWLDTSEQKWTPKAAQVIRPYVSPSKEHDLECFPVPKEVGKVGTESPTFIEPINKRRDGIEAMFAKQSTKSEKDKDKEKKGNTLAESSSTKPASKVGLAKRKRQSPERTTKDEGVSSVEVLSPDRPSSKKKVRTKDGQAEEEPANTDEPNLGSQATTSSSPRSRRPANKPTKSTSSPERASSNTAKITTFFKKG